MMKVALYEVSYGTAHTLLTQVYPTKGGASPKVKEPPSSLNFLESLWTRAQHACRFGWWWRRWDVLFPTCKRYCCVRTVLESRGFRPTPRPLCCVWRNGRPTRRSGRTYGRYKCRSSTQSQGRGRSSSQWMELYAGCVINCVYQWRIQKHLQLASPRIRNDVLDFWTVVDHSHTGGVSTM